MAQTLYRDTGYTLSHLVEEIRHGNIALPDIQRPFVWSSAKIRDLFDSMYRGYPVGTLMFWETGSEVGTRQIGGQESDRVPKLLVVDGQQRLTSLFTVLTGAEVLTKSFERRRIRIAFRPLDETFEVTDAAIERDPEFIPDITALWKGGFRSAVRTFLARLAEARSAEIDRSVQDMLEERVDRVRDLQKFRFQVIELGTTAEEAEVAEIFVRINSEGVQLKQSDFILTLMSVHWEKGRRELEDFCRAAVDPSVTGPSPRNPFLDPLPDQMLRVGVGLAFHRGRLEYVYNLLRGKDLETGKFSAEGRDTQFEALKQAQSDALDLTNWHEYLMCLTAAGFRGRMMITSNNAVIFTYILWLIGRHHHGLDHRTLRNLIGRWFFMAQTTGRYTASPETAIEADLTRVSALRGKNPEGFCVELDRVIRANFTRDYWDISLPNRLDTSASRSPALYAYYAALNVLDAGLLFSNLKIRDLMDPGTTAHRSIVRSHLFPRGFLRASGITINREMNAIANMAFVDWPENLWSDTQSPSTYWAEMTRVMPADQLRQQAYWHALPVGWEQLDYPTFLERRRTLMAKVIRDGYTRLLEGKDPAPPATVQDLIATGESQTIEFKSTARWSVRAGQLDRKLEHVIVKTICALLNAEGGTLLIGVDDNGKALGLAEDWSTLGPRGNRDGYELWLRQLLDTNLSQQTAGIVRIRYETVDDDEICVVSVAASGKPVFARPDHGKSATEFWVRIGNASKQLHGDDMATYLNQHWG